MLWFAGFFLHIVSTQKGLSQIFACYIFGLRGLELRIRSVLPIKNIMRLWPLLPLTAAWCHDDSEDKFKLVWCSLLLEGDAISFCDRKKKKRLNECTHSGRVTEVMGKSCAPRGLHTGNATII